MLTVHTNNIFDQKHCRIITRTSLCNSRNSFGEMFFSSQNTSTKAIVHGLIRISREHENAHSSYKQHFLIDAYKMFVGVANYGTHG